MVQLPKLSPMSQFNNRRLTMMLLWSFYRLGSKHFSTGAGHSSN
jgi:hypothetical protein